MQRYGINDLTENLIKNGFEGSVSTLKNEVTGRTLFVTEAHFQHSFTPSGNQIIWFINTTSEEELNQFKNTLLNRLKELSGAEIESTPQEVYSKPFKRIAMMAEGGININSISYTRNDGKKLHQLAIIGQGNDLHMENDEVKSFALSWSSNIIERNSEELEEETPEIISGMAEIFERNYEDV